MEAPESQAKPIPQPSPLTLICLGLPSMFCPRGAAGHGLGGALWRDAWLCGVRSCSTKAWGCPLQCMGQYKHAATLPEVSARWLFHPFGCSHFWGAAP